MAKKIFIGSTEIAGLNGIGSPGPEGVGISSVVQTTESTVSGGTNVITVTKTDGTTSSFNVRNGDAVGSATIVQTTGDSTTSVMSQNAVTEEMKAAMQKVKVGTSIAFRGSTVTKLSAAQVAAINAAEEITIKWVIRSPTQSMAYRYAVVLSMMPYYFIKYSFFQSISIKENINPGSNWLGKYVNGDNTTASKNRMCCNQSVIINRVTGRVRWYENSTLCVDETSNDYKAEKFVDDSGLIGFYCGDYETRHYCIQIYDYDMSYFWKYPDNGNPMASIWCNGEGKDVPSYIAGSFRDYGYQFVDQGWMRFYGVSGGTTGGNASSQTPYYCSFVEGTAVSGTSNVKLGNYGKGGTWENQLKIVRYPLNVTGGVVSVPAVFSPISYLTWYAKVYDSNGDLVADQNNIGAGDYTVEYICGTGPGAPIYYISGSPTITARTGYSFKPICCIVDIDFGLLYDGNLIDMEADTVYPLWRANNTTSLASLQWAETNKLSAYISHSKAPIKAVHHEQVEPDSSYAVGYYPAANGDILIKGGNIYYGDAMNRVWKRINNA